MTASFLVIQLRQIGDVVLTTPIPHILKEERPGCRVTFLTEAPSHRLLEGNPHIDRVLLSDRKGGWRKTLALGRELRRERFDAVLDFMGNPRSAILSFLSSTPVRVSYPVKGRGILYTHRIRPRDGYAVDYKRDLLGALGIRSAWNRPEIFLSPGEREKARSLREVLLEDGPGRLVTVDPTHRRDTRRWPGAHYGALCAALPARLGARAAVLWGPGEEEDAEAVVAASGGAAVKVPATTLREMAALIGEADLHVGNCSAPRHVAVAVGTPTFTVLGSTSGGWRYPGPEHVDVALGLPCQPCNSAQCSRDRACLRDLSPEQVLRELQRFAAEVLGWELP